MTEIQPKKRKIYDALTALILKGAEPSEITVSDIAAAAGIGKGTVYGYFSRKEDIYFETLADYASGRLDALDKLVETGGSFREVFFKAAEYILNNTRENKIVMGFMLRSADVLKGREAVCRSTSGFCGRITAMLNKMAQLAANDGIIEVKPEGDVIEFAAFSALSYLIHAEDIDRFSSSEKETKNRQPEKIIALCYKMCVLMLKP